MAIKGSTLHRLPKAISGHNQYALWGPRDYNGDVVVAIGFSEAQLRGIFDDVSPGGRVVHPAGGNEFSHLRLPKTEGAAQEPLGQINLAGVIRMTVQRLPFPNGSGAPNSEKTSIATKVAKE